LDIHLSPTHGFFCENWCVAREFADAAKADAVIVNGDLAINGPDSGAEIAFAASALGNLRTRVMALPGNHDVGDEAPGQDPEQITDAGRLARWDSSFATDRWALDAGGWRLIGVNAQLFLNSFDLAARVTTEEAPEGGPSSRVPEGPSNQLGRVTARTRVRCWPDSEAPSIGWRVRLLR
jgi:3',5'-cyclic AMP phosphodiesterase CpdA